MKSLETVQFQLGQGMALVPAGLIDVPHAEIAAEIVASADGALPSEGIGISREPNDPERLNSVGERLMRDVLEPLGLARRLAEPIVGSCTLRYPAEAVVHTHEDAWYVRPCIRLAYVAFGTGKFESSIAGLEDIGPGDMLVQNRGRRIPHGIPKIDEPRLVGVWDFPAQLLVKSRRPPSRPLLYLD